MKFELNEDQSNNVNKKSKNLSMTYGCDIERETLPVEQALSLSRVLDSSKAAFSQSLRLLHHSQYA